MVLLWGLVWVILTAGNLFYLIRNNSLLYSDTNTPISIV